MAEESQSSKNSLSDEEVQGVRRLIGDSRTQNQWRQGDRQTWGWLSLVITVLMLALFAYLYLQTAGIIAPNSNQAVAIVDATNAKVQVTAPAVASNVAPGSARQAVETAANPNVGKGEFRDLLTILVPMFAAGVAFVVSAAGMRRLQSYDDELARARSERREDEKSLREEMREERKQFRDTVEKQVNDALEKRWTHVDEHVSKLFEAEKNTFKTESDSVVSGVKDILEKLKNDFGFLMNRPYFSGLQQDKPISVGDLHARVSKLFSSGEEVDREAALKLLSVALEAPARMYGSPDDWFNLSAELGRRDLELEALRVCKTALDRFSDPSDQNRLPNIDLLAHAIQFASTLGEWSDCKRYVAQAEAMGRARWNWRLFVFVGGYYAEFDEDKFIRLNGEFADLMPNEEHPYSQVSGYWQARGKFQKALETIEEGIAKPQVNASRLLLRKADILLDECRYEEVIETTSRALAATAVDQPGVAQWAVWFKQANAFDALFFSRIAKLFGKAREPDQAALADAMPDLSYWATSALTAYRSAMRFHDVGLIPKIQGEARVRMIRDSCAAHDIDLGKSFVPEDEDVSTPERKMPDTMAVRLAKQIADQVKDVGDNWDDIAGKLSNKLREDFDQSSLALLADELRKLEPMLDPLAAERIRQLAGLLSGA